MLRRRPIATVHDLGTHPNSGGILGVIAELAHLGDAQLVALAAAWTNSGPLADARDHALSPDSPLVLEALCAFEAVSALFADDLDGTAAWVTVPTTVIRTALKAVRDAIAASYAAPALTEAEHRMLMAPWLAVFPTALRTEPDLGPQSDRLKTLLAQVGGLAAHCHDDDARLGYELLGDHLFVAAADRAEAREAAWEVAVLTARRRLWALLRRTAAESFGRPCPTCGPRPEEERRADRRVLDLCLDGLCALLVSDALGDARVDVLTQPLRVLVPSQRKAA